MKRLAGGTIQKMDGWFEGVHLRGAVILVSIGCHWLPMVALECSCHWLPIVESHFSQGGLRSLVLGSKVEPALAVERGSAGQAWQGIALGCGWRQHFFHKVSDLRQNISCQKSNSQYRLSQYLS